MSLIFQIVIFAAFIMVCVSESVPRHSQCTSNKMILEERMKALLKDKKSFSMDNAKGCLGKIAVIGETRGNSAVYMAGIAAFKVGADEVKIITSKSSVQFIAPHSPDITIIDTMESLNLMVSEIPKADVVLLGPGLQHAANRASIVIRVIQECKKIAKPLVLSLDEYFLTTPLYNNIVKYPPPGIILLVNDAGFEEFYSKIKTNNMDDSSIHINYAKLGNNVYIMRKGCIDSGIGSEAILSWAHNTGGSPRRSPGQGSVVAGMTSVFFHWALNNIYFNYTKTHEMLPAAVATYTASVLMRECNSMAYGEIGTSALTSNMIDKIGLIMYS